MMSDNRKVLPLGIDDFKELREQNCYFIDKSLLIKDIIDYSLKVYLLLRPRRFGKTLHLSMLKYFFDTTEDNQKLFEDLAITKAGEKYNDFQGQYPVIFLTLKNTKASTWEKAYEQLKETIISIYEQHNYLLKSAKLNLRQKKSFENILNETASETKYQSSLKFLSECLHDHYDKQVYIFIDEYDTPIHEAYHYNYADKTIEFLRDFLGKALKGNITLKQAVITGILRIAKESLFSGINNLKTYTILDSRFNQYFGWTEQEVQKTLADYNLEHAHVNTKHWYDGYTAGDEQHIYNPWSILSFVFDEGKSLEPYWVNTGNPTLLKTILAKSDDNTKKDLEKLLNHETIEHTIDKNLTLQDFERGDSLWTLLLFSGYLTALPTPALVKDTFPLKIPNTEVHIAFAKMIKNWFSESTKQSFLTSILNELTTGNINAFRQMLTDYIEQALSYFDVKGNEPERFYHALVLGMLVELKDTYTILSNRESGYGRYDVMLIPHDKNKLGLIIEFKKVSPTRNDSLNSAIKEALSQIKAKNYTQTLKSAGVKQVLAIAIAFAGKTVSIKEQIIYP